ncbi:MAG: hypothetical protein ABIS06_01435 [Vicinamibacterales bacterium]
MLREVIASVLAIGCFASQTAAFQAPAAGAAGSPAIKACSLLSKELVAKYWGGDKRFLDGLKPQERLLGKRGSSCDYGTIGLQVDAFSTQAVDGIYKKYGKDWTPVSGVGDRAYFHNNRNRYAELMVVAGTHTLTIQMSVNSGSTAEATKPHTIEVAKAILPKLQ